MKKTLMDCLGTIKDYRSGNAVDHKIIDILAIAILSVLCGADGWTDMEEFGNSKIEWLGKFLELPKGIPSHDTFGRVFAAIDPNEFHCSFMEWVQSLCEMSNGQLIAVDGKTVRRSRDKAKGKAAIHVVSAWAAENEMVLGQLKVDAKSNEITAIPELLKMLDINGCIVSIDAMGTQKDIAAEIKEGGADYVLSLKGNQGTLLEDTELYFQDVVMQDKKQLEKEEKYYKTLDNTHGRFETREYYVCSDIDWLSQKDEWEGLQGIGLCVSQREIEGEVSVEYSYAIYSIEDCTAEQFAKYKRGHWAIENSLHWVLDIAFREDEGRVRKDHAAENLNIIRHMALNLLKQEKTLKWGIKTKRLRCGWDNKYLKKVLELSYKGI